MAAKITFLLAAVLIASASHAEEPAKKKEKAEAKPAKPLSKPEAKKSERPVDSATHRPVIEPPQPWPRTGPSGK